MKRDSFGEDKNFIEFLMRHYKVCENTDGSYTVETSNGTYSVVRQFKSGTLPTQFDASKREESFNKTPISRDRKDRRYVIGRDDVRPDFDCRIGRKHKIKGMFPDQGEMPNPDGDFDSSSEANPLISVDPAFPSKSRHKKFPEPDPDDYNPPSGFDI